ncbi:MAG TPA: cytochrome c [Methyloceanibacter sp.]|nr:cytochrome c [Methyloceanibacter sp.]
MSFISAIVRRAETPALAALSLALAVFATLALAHEGATGVVKERMDLMDRQKDDMKIIGDMAKGKTPFDAAKAAEAARDISVTAKKIPELFPEGSLHGDTEALPAIWKDWDRFTGNAEDLDRVASELATALDADSADWTGAFKQVVEACKACHQDFRKKKKN